MASSDVVVYLDEFRRGPVFALVGTIIPVDIASRVLSQWDALRMGIKKVLVADYYFAKHNPDLKGHRLPEIHAVDLFQSVGYYRKYPRSTSNANDEYWLQHYEWMESGLSILKQNNVRFVAWHIDDIAGLDPVSNGRESLSEQLGSHIHSPRIRAKLDALERHPYVMALPQLLERMNAYFEQSGETASVVCDNFEECKGFAVLEAYDWLRANMGFNQLDKPRFASGLDETFLQTADLVGYVHGQQIHAEATGTLQKDPLARWMRDYVFPQIINFWGTEDYPGRPEQAFLVWMEFLLSNLPDPPRERLRRAARFTVQSSSSNPH